MIKDIFV